MQICWVLSIVWTLTLTRMLEDGQLETQASYCYGQHE